MKRFLILTLLIFSSAGCHRVASPPSVESFKFIQISDTHIGAPGAAEHLQEMLKTIAAQHPDVDFIISSGDLTDWGLQPEWERYAAIGNSTGMKLFQVPGNHDSRWSDNGKRYFRNLFGDNCFSFDHKGIHFIFLDTSLLLEQYGNFSKACLRWLKTDLQNVPQHKPLIIIAHHPPFFAQRFIGNEDRLLDLLEGYNVALILTGHGHGVKRWSLNGLDMLMCNGTVDKDRSYLLFEVSARKLTVSEHSPTDSAAKAVLQKSLLKTGRIPSPFILSLNDSIFTDSVRFLARSITNEPMLVQIDDRPADTIRTGGRISKSLKTFADGVHTLTVSVIRTEEKRRLRKRVRFYKTVPPHILVTAREGIQAGLATDGLLLIAADLSGSVYCLDTAEESLRWQLDLPGSVVARPVISDSVILVSCLDGNLYAVTKKKGRILWRFSASKGFYGEPTIEGSEIFVGNGDGNLYCLSLETGREKWRFATGSLIKNRAAVAGNIVIFGGWDRYVHALNRKNGEELWRYRVSENRYFAAATSDPLIVDSLLVIASHDHKVHALRLKDGTAAWTFQRKDELQPGYSSGLRYGRRIVFGSLNGKIFGLEATTGNLTFSTQLNFFNDPVFDSSPVLWNGKGYLGSINGYLYEFDIGDGAVLRRIRLTTDYIFSTSAVNRFGVFAASPDGRIYRIRQAQKP